MIVCPHCYCDRTESTRTEGASTEYRCCSCGGRHTRREGTPDALAFLPADVARACTTDAAEHLPFAT